MKVLVLAVVFFSAAVTGQEVQEVTKVETPSWQAYKGSGPIIWRVDSSMAARQKVVKGVGQSWVIVELMKHDLLNVVVRNHVEGSENPCLEYHLIVEKREGGIYEIVEQTWIATNCTSCCSGGKASKKKPDFKRLFLPELTELPEDIKKDLRPYLAAIGVKI